MCILAPSLSELIMAEAHLIAPESFVARFCARFEIDARVDLESELSGELGLDSFDLLMLAIWAEHIADPSTLPSAVPPLMTVGDAYAYYSLLVLEHR